MTTIQARQMIMILRAR